MSYPHTLTSLTPREAITDALYRAIIGFDRNDVSIFNSAFAEDVIGEIRAGDGGIIDGLSNVRAQVLDHVGHMDTTHMISNVRVDVKDGANTASLTAYALAQHCPPGKGKEPDAPKYLVGGEYWMDLMRDEGDGLWKIKKWVLDVIWTQGDASVMQKPH
ncbi:uncharacterized protein Z518_06785 [Rhinocladiella mackenziei CBS 650.93]|uniref:SnoaL-like domain-containing protein n=1 Tax=Rhinocladiella mackenziei CBS 650.93 TaxID=1442369 RepID=A0A0D2GYE0_9EURO|nr:uncharacterized protein Z518_06785 [Rhinocladiella mackenziei CBS 650.93]KIX03233.1 hypothetical protein Z518_06785 [Rhinocladiella mackenziei CBS 650.93]